MRPNLMAPSWRGAASSGSAAAKVAKWKRKGSKGDLYLMGKKSTGWGPLTLGFAALVLFAFTGFIASHLWNAIGAEGIKPQRLASIAKGAKVVRVL